MDLPLIGTQIHMGKEVHTMKPLHGTTTDVISAEFQSKYNELMMENDALLCYHNEHRIVYKHWEMDPNDELLLSGYTRSCHKYLPTDVRNVIRAFCGHLKTFTPSQLLEYIHIAKCILKAHSERKYVWSSVGKRNVVSDANKY
eukprot:790822_1